MQTFSCDVKTADQDELDLNLLVRRGECCNLKVLKAPSLYLNLLSFIEYNIQWGQHSFHPPVGRVNTKEPEATNGSPWRGPRLRFSMLGSMYVCVCVDVW